MATFPGHLRGAIRARKSRSQPPRFRWAQPRRGMGYAEVVNTAAPVFWDVTFLFTTAEAQHFQLWFTQDIGRGEDEFTMPIRTEFGLLTHTCQFLPDSLLQTGEVGGLWEYSATIMARELLTA